MEKLLIDTHCHVFNKDIANVRILNTIAKTLYRTISGKKEDTSSSTGMDNEKVKMLLSLINKPDSVSLFEEMGKVYQKRYAIVPLVFDIEYAFMEPGKTKLMTGEEEVAFTKQRLEAQIEKWNLEVGDEGMGDFRSGSKDAYEEDRKRAQLLLKEMEKDRGVTDFITKSSYQRQLDNVKTLKEKYPDFVFPFYGIDPRRPESKQTYKKHLFPNGIYRGIKLYAPAGFSPLDPVLMDTDGVYAFCQENNIPITVHCSYGGFATLMKTVRINGWIHDKGNLIKIDNKLVEFQKNGLEGDWVEERADTLNHPLLWEKVLKAYPKLTLNLAHFGNGHPDWQQKILELMNLYPNLYTDLSCWSELKEVKDAKYCYDQQPESIQKRILYGSDFFLNLLFSDSFEVYLDNFRTTFGADFEKIAGENPRRFLGLN